MNDNEHIHHDIVERIEYLHDNCEDLDKDDKVVQLQMIFDGMRKQNNEDFLAEEIYILCYYSFHDKDAVLHVNIMFPKKGE